MFDKKIEHESFGVVRFSRVTNSGEKQLFGSSVKCSNTIRMEVAPAQYERGLHRDWIMGKSLPYIQVEMSQAQFAEAISSMNIGTGTPVTVIYKDGKYIESFEEESKFEQFQNEFAEDTVDLLKTISIAQTEVEMLLNKKSVTKADRESIRGHLTYIERMLKENMPFLYQSFNEQVGKSLHEAKMEIETFSQQRELENLVSLKIEKTKNESSKNEISKNEN